MDSAIRVLYNRHQNANSTLLQSTITLHFNKRRLTLTLLSHTVIQLTVQWRTLLYMLFLFLLPGYFNGDRSATQDNGGSWGISLPFDVQNICYIVNVYVYR